MDTTSASALSPTRPAASSTEERGSSTNIAWISCQRVLGLVLSLATGAAAAGSGSAAGDLEKAKGVSVAGSGSAAGDLEKAKGVSASSPSGRPGSAAALCTAVMPGYPDAAGAGDWGSPSGIAPAGSQLGSGMFWLSSGTAWGSLAVSLGEVISSDPRRPLHWAAGGRRQDRRRPWRCGLLRRIS